MTTVLLFIAFLFYTIWREWLWHNERKDLYNRLMARDLTEYREEGKRIPPPKAPQSKFISVLKKQNSPSKGGD